MKTKADVVFEFVNTLSLERQLKDKVTKKGYGDRIKNAALIVLTEGVRPAERAGEYTVASGSTEGLTYHVNGACECQDARNYLKKAQGEDVKSFAPDGWCKHKIAVKFETKKLAHLKELRERHSLPHLFHKWSCPEHRHLPIECWHAVCPDPIDLPCPTCTSGVTASPRTGEVEGETAFPEEHQPMISTIAETITSVVQEFTSDPEAVAEAENGPVPTLTFDPVEEAQADHLKRLSELGVARSEPTPPPLPEAPVSMYIKFKVENFELSYTMRAHTDREVIERLPGVLAGLEDILKIEVDHDEPFLKRLLHAFFPKPSRYTGK